VTLKAFKKDLFSGTLEELLQFNRKTGLKLGKGTSY
jgi:hypothetical protein